MRCANLFLLASLILMLSVLPPGNQTTAQEVVESPSDANTPVEVEPGSYRLDYVPLNNYMLEKWGTRRYTMYGFPRKPRGVKDIIIYERERKRIGGIKLKTTVKNDHVIFEDSWGDPAQENGWFDLLFVCKRDNLLSMQTMTYRQGGETNICDVTDGNYELEHFRRRRTGKWPEGTVTEASLLRIFTMLPREPGITYSLDWYTATPEFSPFSTKGESIVCHGQETLKINRMTMECTKYSFHNMQAWVRNVDDALVRFLVPGMREIVISEKYHEYAAIVKEAEENK
jgi:hypothetical protein